MFQVKKTIRNSICFSAVAIIGLWILSGCSRSEKSLGTVTGRVTLDTAPISEGKINFISSSGFAATAELKNGTYMIASSQYGDGIPFGEYQVSVFSSAEVSDPLAEPKGSASSGVEIPLKYSDPATSKLTATINKDATEVNFTLNSK